MAYYRSDGVHISGIACAVPDNYITVDSFKSIFGDQVPEKFSSGTGIKSMYKALPEQTASDLAVVAAENLFENSSVTREEIGLLIMVTQSPDYRRPSSASIVQKGLKLPIDCSCMEINLGCSGFIYGLQTAMSMLRDSEEKYALLVMGETASKLVDPNDKSIVMMYGDAGAAILLEKKGDESTTTLLRSDGNRYQAIVLPGGGFRDMYPPKDRFMCADGNERSLYDIYMDGTAVFSFSITDVPQTLLDYFGHTNSSVDDYDLFVFHQANEFIIKQLIRKLKIKKDKVPISLNQYGNTGGISIPLTLCSEFGKLTEQKKFKTLMSGFGIGLSWGVTCCNIDTNIIYPIVKTKYFNEEGKITRAMLEKK